MSEKIEKVITYFVLTLIIIGSTLGVAYPLMNLSAYAEMMKYPHFIPIPMVQNHIDTNSCELSPASLVKETGINGCITEKKFV